jgi:hypothetical protein
MQSYISRRSFIKNTAIGSAGAIFIPSVLNANGFSLSTSLKNSVLIPPVTCINLIEDSCMLAFSSGWLSPRCNQALASDIHTRQPGNKGRLAGVLPPADRRLMELINILKNNPQASQNEAKLAIVFGWVGVNSAHKHFTPSLKGKSYQQTLSMVAHMDGTILRELSLPDQDPSQSTVADMEEILNVMLPRAIIRTHTIKPDNDDGIGWVNRMSEKRRELKKTFSMYAQAMVNPDHDSIPSDFYNREDSIIVTARKLYTPETMNQEEIHHVAKTSAPKSLYGKALQESYLSILAVDEYMVGKIIESQLEKVLFA